MLVLVRLQRSRKESGHGRIPYINAYNGIPTLFQKIKTAAVPPKFNVDFLSTVLDMKSSSYRAMIPLLKKLGFVDPANVPRQAYKDFREDSLSGSVMAVQLRQSIQIPVPSKRVCVKIE